MNRAPKNDSFKGAFETICKALEGCNQEKNSLTKQLVKAEEHVEGLKQKIAEQEDKHASLNKVWLAISVEISD